MWMNNLLMTSRDIYSDGIDYWASYGKGSFLRNVAKPSPVTLRHHVKVRWKSQLRSHHIQPPNTTHYNAHNEETDIHNIHGYSRR